MTSTDLRLFAVVITLLNRVDAKKCGIVECKIVTLHVDNAGVATDNEHRWAPYTYRKMTSRDHDNGVSSNRGREGKVWVQTYWDVVIPGVDVDRLIREQRCDPQVGVCVYD